MAAGSWSDSAGPSGVGAERDVRRHRAARSRSRCRSATRPSSTSAPPTAIATRRRRPRPSRTTSTSRSSPPAGTDLDYASIFDPTPGVHADHRRRRRSRSTSPSRSSWWPTRPPAVLVGQVVARDAEPDAPARCPRPTCRSCAPPASTRFRYRFASDSAVLDWATGAVVVTVAGGDWKDSRGNDGIAETKNFTVVGPTGDARQPVRRHRHRHQPAQPPQLDRRRLPGHDGPDARHGVDHRLPGRRDHAQRRRPRHDPDRPVAGAGPRSTRPRARCATS